MDAQPTQSTCNNESRNPILKKAAQNQAMNKCNQSLSIELCNMCSVSNKINLVSTYLRSHQNLDMLFLTETWLKPKHNDAMFCPDGYEVIRCDRQGSRGGGVAVMYKNNLQIVEVEVTVDKSFNFELICVDVHDKDSFIRLCCVYFPPAQDESMVRNLCRTLQTILLDSSPVFIFGDLNFPHIDWSVPCNNGNSAHSVFLEFCSSHALVQCVDFPTHNKGNILDLVLCNPTGRNILNNIESQDPSWNTDHFLLSFSLNFLPRKLSPSGVQSPDFNGADYDLIMNDLNMIDWDFACSTTTTTPTDIQHTYDKFISIIKYHISKHIPIKTKHPHRPLRKPKSIRLLLKHKHLIYKQLKHDPSKKDDYKTASKAYISAVNAWHDQIESKICTNPNPKKLYNYANRKLKIKNTIPPLLDDDKKLIFSDLDKANYLNKSFQKFFTKDIDFQNPTYLPPPTFMPNFRISQQDKFFQYSKTVDALFHYTNLQEGESRKCIKLLHFCSYKQFLSFT